MEQKSIYLQQFLNLEGKALEALEALQKSEALEALKKLEDSEKLKKLEALEKSLGDHINNLTLWITVLNSLKAVSVDEAEVDINQYTQALQEFRNIQYAINSERIKLNNAIKERQDQVSQEAREQTSINTSCEKVLSDYDNATLNDKRIFWKHYASKCDNLDKLIKQCMIRDKFDMTNDTSEVIKGIIQNDENLKGIHRNVLDFNQLNSQIGSSARIAPGVFGCSLVAVLSGTAFIAYSAAIGNTSSYLFIGSVAGLSLAIPFLGLSAKGLHNKSILAKEENNLSTSVSIS